MVDQRYAAGDLPWGWWLRANGNVLEDENGRTWRTVRDAFWQGRLGFPEIHVAPEQHELLLRVLTAINAHRAGNTEQKDDLFGGNMLFWRFYQCWLGSIGLLDTSSSMGHVRNPLHATLNGEGRSVMLMLQATRDPEWEPLPMADVIDAVAASSRDTADADREGTLARFERSVGLRRYVFARERVGRSHLVTLTGMATGAPARMPVRRVMWSTSFSSGAARDDLFAWIALRIDRWDDWGGMAYHDGAEALTQHLFALFVTGSNHSS